MSLVFAFLNNYNPSIFLIIFLGFMLGGTGRGWQGLYFSAVSEQVGEEKTGIGVGLSLVFVRLGIILGPPIFGFIADKAGSYSYSWLILAFFVLRGLDSGLKKYT
jgi:MFS family permease